MQRSSTRNPLFLREEELDRSLELLLLVGIEMAAPAQAQLGRDRLTYTDFLVLFLVRRHPGITLAELCRRLAASKQNLSRHVRGLIERGLLARTSAEDDRRKQLLRVTETAEKRLDHVTGLQKRLLRRAFRRVGANAVEGFRHVALELVQTPGRPRAGERLEPEQPERS